MAILGDAYRLKFHNFGVDAVTGGSLSVTELDTKGAKGLVVVFMYGTLGTAGVTVVSVHGEDTGSITPGAGNKLATYEFLTTDLPADANDNTVDAMYIDLRDKPRFIDLIVTAGAQACDLAVLGILTDLDEVPGTATARGLRKMVVPS